MGWSQGGVKQNPKKCVGFQTKLKNIPGPKMNPPPPKKNRTRFPRGTSLIFRLFWTPIQIPTKIKAPQKKKVAKFPNPKRSQNGKFETQKGLSSRTLRGQIEDNTVSICSYSLTKPDRNKITPEHLSSSHWKEGKLSCILHCMFCMYVLTEKFRTLNVLNFSVNFSNFEKHFLFQMEGVINHWFCGNKFPESCLKSLGIIS